MTLLSSIFQRQLISGPVRRPIAVDFSLEAFHCVKEDEHFVNDRETEISVPPFACRFNKSALGGHMLGIADEEGWVQILDTRKNGKKSLIKEWHAHENAVFDIAWMEEQQLLVTASGDQTIRMWDVSRDGCYALFKGHTCSVKSVNFREDDIFVFASGSRDGSVMVWDVRCNRRSGHFCQPVNKIFKAHEDKTLGTPQRVKKKLRKSSITQPVMNSGGQSVTAVVFQGSDKLISAGAVDGKIKIWDLRKSYSNLKQDPLPFHVFPYPGSGTRKHGYSSLVIDSTHSCIFAGCTNDNIYMYSCTSLQQDPVCTFSGHLNSTFYVKAALSPNNMYLISGSSDNDAYIWNVADPSTPVCLTGHVGEVTSVAWCPADQGMVVTCSDDNSFRIWRMDRGVDTMHTLKSVVGKSKRKTSLNPCQSPGSPNNADESCIYRTPVTSPSSSPGTKGNLWTPPTKMFTNPRLNHITSPNGMQSNCPKSPLNRTTLTIPSASSAGVSPQTVRHVENDSSKQAASPVPCSPLSLGHGSSVSPNCPSNKTPQTPKVHSPQQLLSTWLQTNSRKRTHSNIEVTRGMNQTGDRKGYSDPHHNRSNETRTSSNGNVIENRSLHVISDKENNASEPKSPTKSPLRKRLKSLDSNESNNEESLQGNCAHTSGQVNHSLTQTDDCKVFSIDRNKTQCDLNCKRGFEITCQEPTLKHQASNCQASRQLNNGKNRSEHYNKIYGESSTLGDGLLMQKEADKNDEAKDLQVRKLEEELLKTRINGAADDKTKKNILTYFKPVLSSLFKENSE